MPTTIADVLVDGLVRAGAARVFAVERDDVEPFVAAAGRHGLAVVRVARGDVACVMAAVTGTIAGTPGAALIGGDLGGASVGLGHAAFDRAPAVVIGSGPVAATPKASLDVTGASASHWIAHACQL